MRLESLTVANFRAVRHASVTFDETTVFVGENDSGRSSLFEALALALGRGASRSEFAFQPHHFHRGAGGAGSIRLSLRIEANWPGPVDGVQELLFEVVATESASGAISTAFAFRPAHGGAVLENNAGLLAWLRRRMPLVWISGGVFGSRWSSTGPRAPRSESLVQLFEQHYYRLLEGTSPDLMREVEMGYRAAKALLERSRGLLKDPSGNLGAVLEEISGGKSLRRAEKKKDGPLRMYGTAAEKIGVLLLVGAVLGAREQGVEPGAEPLVIIEEPEAHLHPMTLASVWSLLERIAGQKVIGTHSGTLLAAAPLASVRRLTRHDGVVREWRVPEGSLTRDELRRFTYHLRSRRGAASFARCWLLVEGETEFWLLPELARLCGHDFAIEGVACVEFAQSGLPALLKVAQHLGIEWHLLADGDKAGQSYAASARRFAAPGNGQRRVTMLQEKDVEHCFWRYGFADVFRRAAFPAGGRPEKMPAKAVIGRAIAKRSKPFLAVQLLEAVAGRGPDAVPPPLRRAIETCVGLARGCRATALPPGSTSGVFH